MKSETRGRDIFYGVVAVATLIVAIIGATLAYFSITASSDEGAVNAMSANVSISYDDGQQIIAQADELIPATLDVVQRVYLDRVNSIDPANPNPDNLFIDDNEEEVCSVYRFTVSSNLARTISATLNNEENGFSYLSYAVYDVTNKKWLKLDGDRESLPLSTCSNPQDTEATDKCFTVVGNNKTYSSNTPQAINSIFGYTLKDGIVEYQTRPLEKDAVQTYDIVLFINESNTNQNEDQGKNYRGTIIVEVTDGTAGQITGQFSEKN